MGRSMGLRKDWWNMTVKMGEEKCPDEKWDGAMPRWTRDIKVFGEICVGLKLGKQKKIWNKGFDGMMVGCSHESGVGVHRTHNLDTGKIHNTKNVRWMGKMHKECSKEDAESANDSSISDGTKLRAKEDGEKQVEEELLEKMAEATETADSEQSIEDKKEEESEDLSEESPEVEGVGVRTRRQKQEMGDDLRRGKGFEPNLKS